MSVAARLPKVLYVLAAIAGGGALALWLTTGAHVGWTRTSVTEMQHDEVTGIDYPVRRDQFVAGVEVLALGAGAALAFAAAGSALARRQRMQPA
jgi:hypothetical protein